MHEFWKVAAAVFLPNVGGLANSTITKKNMDWYKSLTLPAYCPPRWVFPVAWTGIYSSIGYASYLIWRDCSQTPNHAALLPLLTYGGQLALNWTWTPVFFGMHNIKLALYHLMVLTPAASICGVLFYNINKMAGTLFIPYVSWLLYATLLTYETYKTNAPKESNDKKKTKIN